jgi:hypothetical protein
MRSPEAPVSDTCQFLERQTVPKLLGVFNSTLCVLETESVLVSPAHKYMGAPLGTVCRAEIQSILLIILLFTNSTGKESYSQVSYNSHKSTSWQIHHQLSIKQHA